MLYMLHYNIYDNVLIYYYINIYIYIYIYHLKRVIGQIKFIKREKKFVKRMYQNKLHTSTLCKTWFVSFIQRISSSMGNHYGIWLLYNYLMYITMIFKCVFLGCLGHIRWDEVLSFLTITLLDLGKS